MFTYSWLGRKRTNTCQGIGPPGRTVCRRCGKQGDGHRTADRGYQTHRQARSYFPPVVPGTSMGGPSSPRLLPRRDWTHSLLGNTQLSSSRSCCNRWRWTDTASQFAPIFSTFLWWCWWWLPGRERRAGNASRLARLGADIKIHLRAPPLSTTHSTTTITAPYPASPST